MKSSRLLNILLLLQARGRMTAGDMARQMEVSVRTILRDIDALSAAGVPLYGERGHQGGFQLREGWSTQLTGLTEGEADALFLASLPGPATELGLGAAAASARLKLVASLPRDWREQANCVGERLHIDPLDWFRERDKPVFLQAVADAVWRARRLNVVYASWRTTSKLEIEPLGLVLKAGAWYLLARKPGLADLRSYRVASLRSVAAPGPVFKRPRGFDLASAWQQSAMRFETGLLSLQAHVLASKRCQLWLQNARVVARAVPAEQVRASRRAGWQEFTLHVESVAQGARQMLAYGEEIEVLAPASLRAEVHRQALLLAATHGTSLPVMN